MQLRSCLLAALVLTGCPQDRRPSAMKDAAASATVAAPAPSAAPRARPVGERDATVTGDAQPAPVGGNWLKCYAHFQPRNDAVRDVMRLGLMCGPSNGMRKVTDVREADVTGGAVGREHRFVAQAGDCYRIFAVGEPSVQDLDVEVFDTRGTRIAWDTSDDRWPIVEPDGPFCVMADGEYRAVVRAQRGSGRYAVEIWRLR